MSKDEDTLKEAREAFDLAYDAEADNRNEALDDLRFARLGEQWPEAIAKKRNMEERPMLTINRLPSFIRQVVNDARQNKPQMVVKPMDSGADPETAKVLGGLLKAIEVASNADIAYDTALDFAVTGGFGYWRIDVEYEHNDAFEKGLRIKRIANPFTVYGDPHSFEADSSDWNSAFVTSQIAIDEFERQYKSAEKVDWDGLGYEDIQAPWRVDEEIMLAEWWAREEIDREIYKLSDGRVMDARAWEQARDLLEPAGIGPVQQRTSKGYKITHRLMTGAEILRETEWPGQYIPIVPVYGEELNIEGKRYFRSLIRDAKDAQRMFNYWRTTATELVALAPRVPFIGEEGAFEGDDRDKWNTANTENHAYLSYPKGSQMPQRQPIDSGPAAGALSEAMAASDDLKSIMGLFDASLGAKSNETSGKAILARQREGDVSSFHFIDNLNRGIRHSGKILVDLIPMVYTGERIIRVISPEGEEAAAKIGEPVEGADQQPPDMQGVDRIYNLGAGKYDVTVDSGPSFTTRREEAAEGMMMLTQANPDVFPLIGDLLVKNLDWPGAEEIGERLKAMLPPQALPQGEGALPPEAQMAMDQLQQQSDQSMQAAQETGMKAQQLESENAQLKAEQQIAKRMADLEKRELQLKNQELGMELRMTKMQQEMHMQAMQQTQQAKQVQQTRDVQEQALSSAGENLGQTIAATVLPAVADAIRQAVADTPVKMPRMKRTPVRDKRGLIMHTIDEPIMEGMVN